MDAFDVVDRRRRTFALYADVRAPLPPEPSCAHDPGWVCPLAPAENRLGGEVPVGALVRRTAWSTPAGSSG